MEACVIKSFIHPSIACRGAQAVLDGARRTGRRLPICRIPVHIGKEW